MALLWGVGIPLPAQLSLLLFGLSLCGIWVLFSRYQSQKQRAAKTEKFQRELSTKCVMNTVSTGVHVLLGKMLQNHMLDLRIANCKLFWRALAVLQNEDAGESGITLKSQRKKKMKSHISTLLHSNRK